MVTRIYMGIRQTGNISTQCWPENIWPQSRQEIFQWWPENIWPHGGQEIFHLKVDRKYFTSRQTRNISTHCWSEYIWPLRQTGNISTPENISIEVDRKYFHRVVTRKYQLNGTEEEAILKLTVLNVCSFFSILRFVTMVEVATLSRFSVYSVSGSKT